MGRPHLVPITFALDGDVLYTAVDHKPKRTIDLKRLRNIDRTPDVAVLVDAYDEDWTRLWWCRIDGRAHVVREGDELERGRSALGVKYEQYREHPPAGPVIVVEVLDASGWSATD